MAIELGTSIDKSGELTQLTIRTSTSREAMRTRESCPVRVKLSIVIRLSWDNILST